jgi:hypothetical protein
MMDIRSTRKGLALAALLPVLASPASARWINSIDGWDLNSTPKTCAMSTTFDDDVTIALVWSPSTSELGFMAGAPSTPALAGRKTAPLALSFDGDGPYTQWEDQAAKVIPGDKNVGVIGNWGAEHSDQLASAVAGASHVDVRIGDRDLGQYQLSGSKAAYQALMKCGRLLASN